jgi:hypothetical protein
VPAVVLVMGSESRQEQEWSQKLAQRFLLVAVAVAVEREYQEQKTSH